MPKTPDDKVNHSPNRSGHGRNRAERAKQDDPYMRGERTARYIATGCIRLTFKDRMNIILLALTFIAAAAAAIATFMQRDTAERALAEAAKSTGVALKAVEATQEANRISRIQVEATVRAWLIPKFEERLMPVQFSDDGKRAWITYTGIRVRNTGQLLAFNMNSVSDWGWSPAELPAAFRAHLRAERLCLQAVRMTLGFHRGG